MVYSLIAMVFIFLGSMMEVPWVWNMSDLFNGLMVIPNLIGVLALGGVVSKLDHEHDRLEAERKQKVN